MLGHPCLGHRSLDRWNFSFLSFAYRIENDVPCIREERFNFVRLRRFRVGVYFSSSNGDEKRNVPLR